MIDVSLVKNEWANLNVGQSKSFEFDAKEIDLLAWLANQTSEVKVYFSTAKNEAIAAVGSAKTLNLDQLDQWQEDHGLPVYGGMAFDSKNLSDQWDSFGSSQFVLPICEIRRNQKKFKLIVNLFKDQDEFNLESFFNEINFDELGDFSIKGFINRVDEPNQEQWTDNLNQVLEDIEKDNLTKIVLARHIAFKYENDCRAFCILHELEKLAPQANRFLFQFKEGVAFFGASPEVLYERKNNEITSFALAGTLPRGKNEEQDTQNKNELCSSKKLLHEHQIVVEKLKSRLDKLCEALKCDQTPSVMSLNYSHHLSTKFTGMLDDSFSDRECLLSLHPTPAVGGLPSNVALEQIKKYEPFSRGWFAAPVGRVAPNEVRFIVAIRSALVMANELHVYAGAGIVKGSDPKAEWDEIENKISNLLNVIGG